MFKSTLTEAQVESLTLYRKIKRGELNMRQAAAARTPRGVSLGAYQRVVKQGLNNIRSALRTLLIGVALGYVKVEELKRLIDLMANADLTTTKASTELDVLLDKITHVIVM